MRSYEEFSSDLDRLEYLKEKIFKQINDGTISLKVGDFLKFIEIQMKLADDKKAEEKFWEMIDQIRQEELSDE